MEGAVLRGGAHGELVHVGLAQHDAARCLQFFPHGGTVGGDEVLQHPGGAGGLHPFGADVILHRHRHAAQGMDFLPRCPALVRLVGLLQGFLLRDGHEGTHFVFYLMDSCKAFLRQCPGGCFPGLQCIAHGFQRHFFNGFHGWNPPFSQRSWARWGRFPSGWGRSSAAFPGQRRGKARPPGARFP